MPSLSYPKFLPMARKKCLKNSQQEVGHLLSSLFDSPLLFLIPLHLLFKYSVFVDSNYTMRPNSQTKKICLEVENLRKRLNLKKMSELNNGFYKELAILLDIDQGLASRLKKKIIHNYSINYPELFSGFDDFKAVVPYTKMEQKNASETELEKRKEEASVEILELKAASDRLKYSMALQNAVRMGAKISQKEQQFLNKLHKFQDAEEPYVNEA